MMVGFRFVFGLLLLAGIGCFAAFAWTSNRLWLRRGVVIVKWTVLAAAGFFAVLIVERLLQG